MQRMLLTRNSMSIRRSSSLLISTAMASYSMYYCYNRFNYMMPSWESVFAEAEGGAKEDPYTRSRGKALMKNHEDAVIIGGQSNPELAKGVAAYLGVSLAKSEVRRFADGETSIKVLDNVNGK
jgi:hypothetical protein